MPRRVPIWRRGKGGMFYYTDAAGKRRSLHTKDRARAIELYNGRPEAKATVRKVVEKNGAVRPSTLPETPPPSASPLPTVEPEPSPPAPPPPPHPNGGGAGDPLQWVGATAGTPPIQPDGIASPNGAGGSSEPPPSVATEAEVREIASWLAGGAELITARIVMDDGIDPAPPTPELERLHVDRAMPLARRLAQSPIVRSFWAELAMFGLATVQVAMYQRQHGTPLQGRPSGGGAEQRPNA